VRLVAYRRLPDYPLVVVAAKSQDEALAEFLEHRRVYLGLALAGTLVLIAFFAVLAWVVQRLQGRTRQLRSQRGFLQTLLDNIPVGISVRELREDGSGTYLIWNETNAVMYGAPKEAALGHRVDAVAPPATAARVLEWDREMIASPSVQEVVEVARLTNGVEAHINRVRAPIFDVEDAARYVITVSENITRRRAAEDDLRLASKVFETTADGIVITDRDDRVITVNSAFTALTGFAESDLLGQKIYESRFNPLDPEAAAERMERLRREGRVMAAVKRRHRDGHELDLWLTATIVRDEAGTLVNLVRIFTDISELKNAQRRLEHLANFDELTGLPNRRLFNDRIEQAVLRARRSGQGVALLFLDVDEFKTVNDTWGHDVGDQLLKGVAGRLAHCVRNTDSLCRLGGDEFTVILEGASLREHAIFVAARIKRELARPILAGKHQVQVSASIGIALFPANATTSTELVSRADAAMYVAKAEGGNRYAFFEPPAQDATA
jgi:diguanylate cyclase (GGDEF)-like protein/PAS domain S-box-containing protein